jgi:hypothetical protein
MTYTEVIYSSRLYRFSHERKNNSRPWSIQYQKNDAWRDVINIDRIHFLWLCADVQEAIA